MKWLFSEIRENFLKSLKTGDVFPAKVVECIENGEVIVNLKGNLVRARNETSLLKGSQIKVRVVGIKPLLVFEVINEKQHIDYRKSTFEIKA